MLLVLRTAAEVIVRPKLQLPRAPVRHFRRDGLHRTTGGGAHPTGPHRIDERFTIVVPDSRPINPISMSDWEGTGVTPDVKVDAEDALKTAEALAAKKLRRR